VRVQSREPDDNPVVGRLLLLAAVVVIVLVLMFLQGTFRDVVG
jgi:hypothetical protein